MKKFDNWKLAEISEHVEIVSEAPGDFKNQLFVDFKIPTPDFFNDLDRSSTEIDWQRMPQYFKFCFDFYPEEDVKIMFLESDIVNSPNILVLYGQEKMFVKLPTQLFINDWEGFIRSTGFETLIFSEDFRLVMEISRDYYLHSNFEISKLKESLYEEREYNSSEYYNIPGTKIWVKKSDYNGL